MGFQVGARQPVGTFDRLSARQCHQLRQIAVAGAVLGEHQQLGARRAVCGQLNLGPMNEPERARQLVALLRLDQFEMRSHAACERAFVGHRKTRVTER